MEQVTDFISASCGGERCSICGNDAAAKVEETIFHDDPQPIRHPFTAYVCKVHFRQIMDRGGYTRPNAGDVEAQPAAYWARYSDGSGRIFENKEHAENYAENVSYGTVTVIPLYSRLTPPGQDAVGEYQTRLALQADQIADKDAVIERLTDALRSIAGNSCCGSCQEAKLVAQEALRETAGGEG